MEYFKRVTAIIDLDAFSNNIRQVKKNVPENVKIMAVVKADGYGHGAYETAVTALLSGADILGVAILKEAVELREKGITAPITIVGASFEEEYKSTVKYGIEQTVFCIDTAKGLSKAAKELGMTAKLLVKLDTGMGRLGFLPEDNAVDEISEIFKLENVEVTGIFTHLSCSDSEDKSYSHMQNERFKKMLDKLKEKGINLPALHISNSGAIISLYDMRYDVVRAGLIQYGFFPSCDMDRSYFDLKPVMSINAQVTFVKTIKKGECVGYSATFKAERDTIVATIPVGYADGYSRKMGNRGRVIINGEYAPIIGTVCMDQFMVDVTNIGGVKVGDSVILMGKQKDKEITAYEIADLWETITYEVVCAISKRVPRLYIKDGKCYKSGELPLNNI